MDKSQFLLVFIVVVLSVVFVYTNKCVFFFSFPSVFSLLFSYFSLSFTAEFCWARQISSHHNKIDGCKFSVTTRYTNLIQNKIHAYILHTMQCNANKSPFNQINNDICIMNAFPIDIQCDINIYGFIFFWYQNETLPLDNECFEIFDLNQFFFFVR